MIKDDKDRIDLLSHHQSPNTFLMKVVGNSREQSTPPQPSGQSQKAQLVKYSFPTPLELSECRRPPFRQSGSPFFSELGHTVSKSIIGFKISGTRSGAIAQCIEGCTGSNQANADALWAYVFTALTRLCDHNNENTLGFRGHSLRRHQKRFATRKDEKCCPRVHNKT